MSIYRDNHHQASRPFVVVAYIPGPDGVFRPQQLPSLGQCFKPGGKPCELVCKAHRQRKTGPLMLLTVLFCKVHQSCFTLYPPGFVPYGRQPIAPVAADGSPLRVGNETSDSSSLLHQQRQRWTDTVLEAALDAARGKPWKRASQPGLESWWSQQGRRLRMGVRLMGLDTTLSEDTQESAARALGVDTLLLRDLAATLAGAPGYRLIGQAIAAVLSALEQSRRNVLDAILRAGYVTGLWGPPLRWDTTAKVLRRPILHPPEP